MASKVNFAGVSGVSLVNGIPLIDPAAVKFIVDYNVRDQFSPDTDQADAELVANMGTNGFIADKPVTLRIVGADAYCIAGHRRISAANWINSHAGTGKGGKPNKPIKGITFILEAKGPDGNVRSPVEMSYDLELSNTGKPLSAAERGANILRLRAMGEADETIAQRLGIGTRWVRDLASLGKADPRLKKLVKAGVIPPATAIELVRAHGQVKAVEVANRAVGAANARGKANATSQDVAKGEVASGVEPKVGAKNVGKTKGADKRPTDSVKVTVAKAASVPAAKGATVATLVGPFRLGSDLDDCTIYGADDVAICELADATMAKAVLNLFALGWGVLKGKAAAAVESASGVVPVKATPRGLVAPIVGAAKAADAAAVAATAREAERAAHKARVASQMAAVAAERDAKAAAVQAAAVAMLEGKADATAAPSGKGAKGAKGAKVRAVSSGKGANAFRLETVPAKGAAKAAALAESVAMLAAHKASKGAKGNGAARRS